MATWGTPSNVDMTLSWPSMPPPKPNNSQEIPIPWGSDRPSAPSENNTSPKKDAQDSWGQNRSENSYISRNDVVQFDRFPEKSFPGKESTKLPDNVPPVNTGSPPGVNKINDHRDDDQQLADIALQAVLQNSFESEKERKEQNEQQNSEDLWDPTYRKGSVSDKGFRDVGVQTDQIDLTEIIASKEKLLSCTIDSQIMKDYQQNVPEKRHSSQQSIAPSLLDLGPGEDEWENTFNKRTNVGDESSWNKPSGKSDFRDNVISPTIPETNAREPDNDSRKPIQPPNNENPSRNNNLDFGPQPTSVQANSRGPPPSGNPDWGTVSQQTPTQDNFYSPVRDNQSNKNDRSQDVSSNKPDSWEDGLNEESDWTKKAETFEKELGMSKETKDQRTEEAYGTFNYNSPSNNRYGNRDSSRDDNRYGNRDVSRDGNRYGNRDVSRDGNRDVSRDGNRDVSRDGNRYGNRGVSRDSNRDVNRDVSRDDNRYGNRGVSRDSNRDVNRDVSRDDNRYGNRGVSRDDNRYGNRGVSRDSNRDDNRYGNRTDESSRDGYGSGRGCFKCGEEGHMARDCTKESSRGGKTCHKCNKEGHLARDCPDEVCYKCNKPGHRANECIEDAYETTGQDGNFGERSRDYNHPKFSPFSNPKPSDISSEDAWVKLLKADKEKDIDDFKEAFELYAKATPRETFQTIERKLRDSNCNARIVALKREEIPLSSVLVDLQGITNKKYVATPVMGPPSSLRRTAGDLAQSPEENFEWLADAGFMVDDNTPICYNCKQKGHLTRDCREPKREPEKQSHIACQNCGSLGHITKYCDEQRRDYYTEARDRKAAGSHNRDRDRDPIYDDKASSIYDGDEGKGFRGYSSSGSQTCHNCHREGHKSRDCPEKLSGGGGGGRKCFKCNEEGHLSKDCNNSGRGNYNDYNQTASLDTDYNNSRSKTGGDNSQWNKSSTISRDDQNYDKYSQNREVRTRDSSVSQNREPRNDIARDSSVSQSRDVRNDIARDSSVNREVRNDIARDSSVSTQDRTIQQKDITPYNTEKRNVVEPDSWESNTNAAKKVDWGNKTHTFADFNWETNNNKKEPVSDKQPEDYENKRGDPYNKGSEDYENRRGRSDYSYNNNKGSDDYDNRRGRGTYNNNTDDWRGRGNNSSYNKGPDDYDNRRGRGNNNTDDYDNRRGRGTYNNNTDDWRGRGNNSSYNKGPDDYDNRRGRGNSNTDDYDRRGRGTYNNNTDDYRGRDNSSYNNKSSDDYGRGRGNDSYSNKSDDYGRGRNNSYNNRSDDYGRGRGNDSYNNRSDDYGRSRGNDSYNNRSDDYGRSRGNDDYGRSRGNNSYNNNNDYGRGRGNDSYNKGSSDYGRNRGNDFSYNRGSDDHDRRDRRTQEPREQNTQSNAPAPNLDNVQTWW